MCRPFYLLGFLSSTNRVYLGDKDLTIVGFQVQLSVLQYQTAVMRGDFEAADKVGALSVSCSLVFVQA